jgi:hypothetical protein
MEAWLPSHQAVARQKEGWKPAHSGILAADDESLSGRAFMDNASFQFTITSRFQMITLIALINLIESASDHARIFIPVRWDCSQASRGEVIDLMARPLFESRI